MTSILRAPSRSPRREGELTDGVQTEERAVDAGDGAGGEVQRVLHGCLDHGEGLTHKVDAAKGAGRRGTASASNDAARMRWEAGDRLPRRRSRGVVAPEVGHEERGEGLGLETLDAVAAELAPERGGLGVVNVGGGRLGSVSSGGRAGGEGSPRRFRRRGALASPF